MKTLYLLVVTLLTTTLLAQKPCELATNVTDSIGTLKETKSCVMYEKVFGGKTTLISISLASESETPILKLQHIQKSKDFEMPKCFDKSSKVVFQLSNGKIYTMLYAENDKCDQLIYNEKEKLNNRYVEGNFLLMKDDFTEITKFPISFMRIRFAGENTDYVIQKELNCETLIETYFPANFFIDNFNCIAN